MAHELVVEAKAVPVHHLLAVDGDGIVERRSAREAGAPQTVDIVDEAEGSRRRNVIDKSAVCELHGLCLSGNHGRIELDLEFDGKAVGGHHRDRGLAVAYGNRLAHANRAALRLLILDTGLLDQRNERRGAAIHRRDLGPIERHHRVIDAHAGECGHQMFDGRDGDAVAVADHGRQPVVHHMREIDGDLAGFQRGIGPADPDAVVRRRGKQGHGDTDTAVQANAVALRRTLDRRLTRPHSLLLTTHVANCRT